MSQMLDMRYLKFQSVGYFCSYIFAIFSHLMVTLIITYLTQNVDFNFVQLYRYIQSPQQLLLVGCKVSNFRSEKRTLSN